ncbi:MAG: PIG-L family deacetylase [Acidobacteriota bacterium]
MKRFALAFAIMSAAATGAVALESGMNAGALAHELDRVANTTRVLYVAAHPDDENTRLLGYLANNRHMLAAYLSMTRGGGGQNLIGSEQGVLLDVIRNEELLAARRIDGAVQRFTRMRDFGYSKSAAETLAIWNHDEALADVVWAIRSFQPDIVIARFDEDPPNHGHHTASAILAREAFTAAADPKRFPEQLKSGVIPWQAARLLRNISSWSDEPPPPEAIALQVGDYDVRLGVSYGELAAQSRSQHKSQGFGVSGSRSPSVERFLWLAGTKPQSDIFEGLDSTWGRFGAPAAALEKALDEARATLERDRPERALPALLAAHRAFDPLPDEPRVRDAKQRLDRLICVAAGVFARATAEKPVAVPGSDVKLSIEVVMRQPASITLQRLLLPQGPAIDVGAALVPGTPKVLEQRLTIPGDAAITTPFWLASTPQAGHYVVANQRLVAEPSTPPAVAVELQFTIGDRQIVLHEPVLHSWTDPVQGERLRPLMIVPPATVTPTREAVMFPNGRSTTVSLRVRTGRDDLKGDLSLPMPAGWKVEPASQPVTLAKVGDEATLEFTVTPPADAKAVAATPVFTSDGRNWSYREDRIDYPHIPFQLVLQPAALRLVPLALNLPKGTIGYIRGSGDSVADDLAHVGLHVEMLDDEALRSGDLGRFAAIVVGIRAYNTRDVVRAAHARLMKYVEAGGTVVVQYNTNNRLSSLDGSLGPFPLEIGRDRVTDEKAIMTTLIPDHPVLNRPNKISTADFEGWVQERGIYFALKWDPRYKPLFSAADPDEKPTQGSTLIAEYGKGRYVYTGLAFFRQLPAGVPGAYRLFVNLIAGQ